MTSTLDASNSPRLAAAARRAAATLAGRVAKNVASFRGIASNTPWHSRCDAHDACAEATAAEHAAGEELARQGLLLDQLERAIALIDDYLARYPRHRARAYSRYFRATYLMRLGRVEDAVATLDALERAHPSSSLRPHAARLRARLQQTRPDIRPLPDRGRR